MGRRKNPNRKPISNRIRVQMHRERKKMKQERQRLLDSQVEESDSRSDRNNSFAFGEPLPLKSELRNWAQSYRITTRALDSLLDILNAHGIDNLPKNHRTILSTPINVEYQEIAGGELWYHGLQKSLIHVLSELDTNITVSLNFNVDGLPLYNSCFFVL